MIYVYHHLLNLSTSGINTWCKLFKSNLSNLCINIIDNIENIIFSSHDILIVNHLSINKITNHHFTNSPTIILVIHNLDKYFINLINTTKININYIISIFPINIIKDNNLMFSDDKIFFLPNIDLTKNTIVCEKIHNLQFNNTFYYYGRIDYEKNIILLIDLMQYHFITRQLIIIYPHNTHHNIINFYQKYIDFCNIKNVIFIKDDEPYEKGLIYLSAGTMEGLPYTYLELLSNNKIIISYNSGTINDLLDDDFIITYNKKSLHLPIIKKSSIIDPLLTTKSYTILPNIVYYKQHYTVGNCGKKYPFIDQHLLIPTYLTQNNIHKTNYLEHLDLWVQKISNIVDNIEYYLKKSNQCYYNWFEMATEKWTNNKLYNVII